MTETIDQADNLLRETPLVTYDRELENASYIVTVDREKLGKLLQDEGWPKEDINSLEIFVRRGHKNAVTQGDYNSKDHKVTFNTEWLWKRYKDAVYMADRLSNGDVQPNNKQFDSLLTTKRLSDYLVQIPDKERGLEFANKLLLAAVERKLTHIVLHELGHGDDEHNPQKDPKQLDKKELLNLVKIFGSAILLSQVTYELIERYSKAPESVNTLAYTLIGVAIASRAIAISYRTSPREKRANEFAYEKQREFGFENIVSIDPK